MTLLNKGIHPMPAWSGLWNEFGEATGHSLLVNKSSLRKRLSLLFRQRGNAVLKELMLELNGAAAGDAALAQRTRVTATQQLTLLGNGGAVDIETVDLVNRNTTAADATDIASVLSEVKTRALQADISGNGGGGKLGV